MLAIDLIPHAGENRLQLSQFPTPQPRSGQVLIQVAAAGVNRPDLMQRQGLYPPPAGASPILGLEVAGTVVAVGDADSQIQIGDSVCALLTGGGYAEFCLAGVGCCLPIPNGFNWYQAAALPETVFTAWSNLLMRGGLSSGETLLLHGGGSGIGSMAIQLAKALGCTVYVTAGSDEKCQRCLSLGADAAINYQSQDFVSQVQSLTAGRGVDMVLDIIGGEYLARNLKCLAVEGRLLQIAIQNGAKAELNLWPLMQKRLTITGSTLRGRDDVFKASIAKQLLTQVWPLLATGQIQPVIDSVFKLADAEQAHARMASNQHFGKIILEV